MRKLYSDRREFFIQQFNDLLKKHFVLEIPEAGLHFVAWLRQKENLPLITRVCGEIGMRPSPLSSCFMKAEAEPALTFGFAHGRIPRTGEVSANSLPQLIRDWIKKISAIRDHPAGSPFPIPRPSSPDSGSL